MKTLFKYLLLLTVVFSCKKEVENLTKQISKSVDSSQITKSHPAEKPKSKGLKVSFVKINEEEFNTAKALAKPYKHAKEKITDFKVVQEKLKGVVTFKEDGDYLGVKAIRYRNGKPLSYEHMDEYVFVAYFPEEDILLLEGGHTTDISYDLKTGKETYDVGNPDLATTSPTGKYQLNKLYEGQECFYHFLQKKNQNTYEPVLPLNDIFEKETKKWLCVIGKEFWTDDQTIYFGLVTEYREEGSLHEYYKVSLTE